MRVAAIVALLLAMIAAPACKCRPQSGQVQSLIPRGTPPSYDQVAAAYNLRIDPLTRLTAPVVVRLKYRDQDGRDQEEQVEGRYSFVRPRKMLLSLGKAGQIMAYLGGNAGKYWWIELGENKRAIVGDHDKADVARLASVGIPVHPLDLIELLGTSALPTHSDRESIQWTADGRHLLVQVPGRIGSRRFTLDPETYRPSRIELIDEQERVVASSDLAKYESVSIRGAGPEAVHPWIATDLHIVADSGFTQAHIEFGKSEIDPSKPKVIEFDLARLLAHYEVERVRDLDAPVR